MKTKPVPRPWVNLPGHKLRVLARAFVKFNDDYGFFLSSGITFNFLMSLIPFSMLLLAVVGTYLYNSEEVLLQIRRYLQNVAPSLDPQIMENLLDIIKTRQVVGIIGLAGLIWVSSMAFSSLRIGLNIVFDVKQGRGIIRGLGIDLLMILLAGTLLLLSMVLTSVITFLEETRPWSILNLGPALQWALKYPLPFSLSYVTFFLTYKIIPNRNIASVSALQGALFASVSWEIAKHLFGWYVVHLSRYHILYGSLSTLIIFIFWVYYSVAILLVGGEFAWLLERESAGPPPLRKESGKGPDFPGGCG
jgi:membrane protein